MTWWALLPLGGVVALSAVVLLRRRPLLAVGLMLGGSIAIQTMPGKRLVLVSMLLPMLLTGFEVCFIAATRSRSTSIAAATLAIGVQAYWFEAGPLPFFGLTERPTSPLALSQTAAVVMTIVVAWLVGFLIRQSQVHAEALRAQSQAQAATAERLRIARELHDMIAHSIGVIAIQAGMGSRVIDTQPDEARDALSAIEAASRETLAGLRRMLGALRRAESAGAGQRPLDPALHPAPDPALDLAPDPALHPALDLAPGLADLGRLAAITREAGVRVDVQWCGQPRPLPAEVDLSAFRIIQEAVANVVRHAGADHCRVLVDQRGEELSIEITDDGRGGVVAATGFGIVGMRERAALLGGRLTAGPRPGGGFRVTAQLPVPARV